MTALSTMVMLLVAAPPPSAWLEGERFRRELNVTVASDTIEVGYSYRLTFDHAAEVAAGSSSSDGRDVRIARWDGATFVELHRVLDSGSAWNQPDTTLWFATDVTFSASSGDLFLFHGDPNPPAPRESPDQVFVFADDFESGDLSKWTPIATQMAPALEAVAGVGRDGGFGLRSRPEVIGGQQLVANIADPPSDQLVDVWAYSDDLSTQYWALFLRFDPVADDSYNCGPNAAPMAYVLGHRTGGTYGTYGGARPSFAGDSGRWVRMSAAVTGDLGTCCAESRCTNDGTPIVLGERFADGGVGFGRLAQSGDVGPDGGKDLIFDDFRVRRFRLPEPTVSLGLLERGPGEPCAVASDCASRDCTPELICGASQVVADAGADPQPDGGTPPSAGPDAGLSAQELEVSCDCDAAPAAAGSLLAWVLLIVRARRRGGAAPRFGQRS